MSKDLPEFTRSVGVTPAKVVDVQAPFDQLSKVLEQFSQGAQRLATRAATERATQEGAQAGVAPDFKGDLAPGITAPTKAFNDAALAANKTQTQMDIRSSIQQIHDFVTNPQNLTLTKQPIQTYDDLVTKKWNDLQQGIAKQNLPFATNYFQFEAGNSRRSVVQKVNVLQNNMTRDGYVAAQIATQQEANNLANSGDLRAAGGLFGLQHQTNEAAVQGGITTQPIVDNVEDNFRKGLQTQGTIGSLQRSLQAGTSKQWWKDYHKAKLPDLDPVERANLTAKLVGTDALFHQGNAVFQQSLNPIYNAHAAALQAGRFINPELAAQLPQNPRLAAKFALTFQKATLIGTGLSALRYASAPDTATFLAGLPSRLANVPEGQAVLNAIVRKHKQQLTARAADPFGYNENNPIFIQAQLQDQQQAQAQIQSAQASIAAGGVPLKANISGELIANQDDVMLTIQRKQGIPEGKLSLMSNATAITVAAQLEAEPADQRMADIQGISEQHGANANIILRDLYNHGVSNATATMVAANNNKASRPFMADMMEVNSFTPKELTEMEANAAINFKSKDGVTRTPADVRNAVIGDFSDYFSSLDGGVGATTITKSKATDLAMRYAYQLAQTRGMGMVEAVKTATGLVANNYYNYASQAGHPALRVPIGVDSNDAVSATGFLVNEANTQPLKIPNYIFPNLSPEERQEEYRQDINKNARLVTNPDGMGMTLVSGPQSKGQPVLTADGQRIEVSFADINSGTSPVSDFISASPIPRFLLTETRRRSLTGRAIRATAPLITATGLELAGLGNLVTGGKVTEEQKQAFVTEASAPFKIAEAGVNAIIKGNFALNNFVKNIPKSLFNATKREVNKSIANLPPAVAKLKEAEFKKLQASLGNFRKPLPSVSLPSISLTDVTNHIKTLVPQAGKAVGNLAVKIFNSIPKQKKAPSGKEFLRPAGEAIDKAIKAFKASAAQPPPKKKTIGEKLKEAKLSADDEQDKLVQQLIDAAKKRKK